MITKAKRPLYLDFDKEGFYGKKRQNDNEVERDFHFRDIIIAALESNEKSLNIIELIKLMKHEISQRKVEHPEEELNYKALFKLFV